MTQLADDSQCARVGHSFGVAHWAKNKQFQALRACKYCPAMLEIIVYHVIKRDGSVVPKAKAFLIVLGQKNKIDSVVYSQEMDVTRSKVGAEP